MLEKIKHVFVIMFENRSFDHMLGFSNIKGKDAVTGEDTQIEGISEPEKYKVEYPVGSGKFFQPSPDAAYSMKQDPPHEFKDTLLQLCGPGAKYEAGKYPAINNSGFVASYAGCDPNNPGENMKCFSEQHLPVLHQLAREFAVCDHWFSSVPGPTWPNRFFLHAGTSGGLDDSPQQKIVEESNISEEFNFRNGNIFDRLNQKNVNWLIYEGDEFTQSFTLHGMQGNDEAGRLQPFKKFKEQVNDPRFSASYIFIEPSYGYVITDKGSFKCGNSQHPLDDVRRGEKLLKEIYETIRNSPHWETSCLLVLYDEHGGFYDHVPSPPCEPPGDGILDPAYNQNQFEFNQLGVRVPAIIISPLIPKNTIDHTVYDHSSVLKTLEKWLQLDSFTGRDRSANSFEHLFSLGNPRKDATPSLEKLAPFLNIECNQCLKKVINFFMGAALELLKSEQISATARGFLHLAFLKKIHASPEINKAAEIEKFNLIGNKAEALKYMEESRKTVKAHDAAIQSKKDAQFVQLNKPGT
jgi:phospholipase C